MTNLEKVRVNLEGYIKYYQDIKRFSEYVLPAVPDHKQVTKRIEKALNDKLGEVCEWNEYDDRKFPKSYFSLSTDSGLYDTYHVLTLYTDRFQAPERFSEGSGRSMRDSIRSWNIKINTAEQVREALQMFIEHADKYITEYTAELARLNEVEADYKAFNDAKAVMDTKYSYLVREQFPTR